MAGLADLLAAQAGAGPDTPAVVVVGASELSFGSWERRSNALARGLVDHGIRAGDRVVLWFDSRRWTDYAVAGAAVLKAGAVAVPVGAQRSGLDLAAVVNHCGAAAIVAAADSVVPPSGRAWVASVDELADGRLESRPPPSSGPPDAVEILYPSGHLWPPRPTVHTPDEILAHLARPGISGGSTIHAFAVGSDAARLALWAPLAATTVVTLPALDPERLCALTEERGVDSWLLTAATALLVVESGAVDRHDVSTLRRVDLVGPRPATAVVSRVTAAFASGVVHAADRSGPGASERRHHPVPPDPQVVETVAAVFGRVLGVPAVGAGDDFFAMGGHQMAAVKALRLLDDAFDVRLEPAGLLAAPTAAALAAVVERARAVSPSGEERPAPVAFSQEGMLWQEQFVPGSQNLPPLVRRFTGPLDIGVLEASLDEIVRRHEPLRSRFERREGRLVQVVADHRPVPLPVHDLGALDPGDREAALADALARAGRPFDLVGGPLFEPELFRFGPEDHVAVFRVHHSVYDDWSVSVFRRELSALYTAFSVGRPSPLPDLALGFAEFSRAQRRRLAGPVGAAQLSWWKAHLAGAPFGLQLPVDDPALVEGSPQPSARPVTVEVPPQLYARVRALAREQRATTFMTMLAAFEALVHRYTGLSDLLMASVVANRNRPELETMIGCFTKKVLLRLDMAGDPTFAEVLGRTRVSVLSALSHQELPFETVLQETVGPAAAEHGLVPYVGVMFQGVTPQVDEVVLPGVSTSGYDTSATTTRAHFAAGGDEGAAADTPWGDGLYLGTFLILSLVETADAASLVARGAFHGPAVERLLANLVSLLEEVVADPQRPMSELRMLDDDQWRELAEAGSMQRSGRVEGAYGDPQPDQNAAVGLEPTVDRCGHELFRAQVARTPAAVAVRTGSSETTYAALGVQVDALAGRLAALGVGRVSLLGVCLEPSASWVVAVLAVWAAGAAWVALDLDDDPDHVALVVADAAPDVIVTREAFRPLLARCAPGTTLVDVEVDAADDGPRPSAGVADSEPGDVAMVFYGSGASAVERPVVVEHRSVANLVAWLRDGVHGAAKGLRVGLSARPTDDAFVRQVAAVLDGHTLCIPEGGGVSAFVSLVAADGVDVLDLSPEQVHAVGGDGLQDALSARPAGARVPTILAAARGPLDRRLWLMLRALRGARPLVAYATPECGFGATVDDDPRAGARTTIGRPAGRVTARVLGPAGTPVPVQVTGELYVGGEGLARGQADGRTGRRARRLPDGRIELLGATADVVGLRGFSVDRARLRTALVRSPAVRDARVVVEGDAEGTPRLVAYVEPVAGASPLVAELRVHVWRHLPGYAWPACLVVAGEARPSAGTDPGTAEEALLAALWAEVEGVDGVDARENYWQAFSFLDVVTRAVDAGVPIGREQVTRNRTVATLAADLAAGRQPIISLPYGQS